MLDKRQTELKHAMQALLTKVGSQLIDCTVYGSQFNIMELDCTLSDLMFVNLEAQSALMNMACVDSGRGCRQ